MKIDFVKMHGAGNDFVMIDGRALAMDAFTGPVIAKLANRPDGIGCEGVIFVLPSSCAGCDFRMRFFNPDGTEAELCGNGARCVAAFARSIGAVGTDRMRFETLAGEVEAEILDETTVKVRMPDPKDLGENFVNSGVPHAIVPVEDLERCDVDGEGRRIRYSEKFAPAGTNVDFVTYSAPGEVHIRTYERGVEAESGACGTGSVAAAVVGVAQYGMKFPVKVRTAGGYTLEIDGGFDGEKFTAVTLAGPVATLFRGSIEL